ncbi:MAG: copper-binding protein [Planctomycetota bacterium]
MRSPRVLPLLTLLCLPLLTGCPSGEVASSAPTTPAVDLSDPATKVYDVRGFIVALPDPANPASDLQINHEEIPDFVNVEGEVSGMKAMVMPFPLAPGVSLEGLAVGDPVALSFAVNWDAEGSRPWELTQITKLDPADAQDIAASRSR